MSINLEIREEDFLQDELPPHLLAVTLPDESSARLVERLKQESDRNWYRNPQRSLRFAERIVSIGRLRDDPNQVALGLLAQGNALKFAMRLAEAWDALQQSGQMFQTAGNEVGWARTRISILDVALHMGSMGCVLSDARRAREIFRAHRNDEMLVRLDIAEGLVSTYLGEHQRALQFFSDGLLIAAKLSDRGQLHRAPLYLNMGYTYEKLGDYHQALAYYEPAHELLLARDETPGSDTAKINIAYVARIQGRYRYALKILQEIVERSEGRSLPEKFMAQSDLVECYLHLNRYEEARELALQVTASYRSLGDVYGVGRALLHLALADAKAQKFDEAQAALAESEQIFLGLGAGAWVATARLHRGRIALQRGELAAALEYGTSAESQFASGGQQDKYAQSALLRGQVLLACGDLEGAAAAAGLALRVARERGVPSLRYQAHLLLGRTSEVRCDMGRAARRYQAAAATMARVQSGLTITLRAGFLEDKEEALRALIALCLREGREREAFETLERAKAQVLLGYLTNRDSLRWSQDDARNRTLIAQLNVLRDEHQHFFALAHRAPGNEDAAAMPASAALAEANTRERKMRALIEQLYLQSGEVLEGRRPVNASLADIQGAVSAASVLVEYYVDGGRLWAFCLDGRAVSVKALPIDVQAVGKLLSQFRLNVSAALGQDRNGQLAASLGDVARRILRRLHAGLIEPLGLGQSGRRRLQVVPYGLLHYLPFHLLYDGSAYLVEQYEVVVLPAASLALRPLSRRDPSALVLTHSWDGRLPQTGPEGRMVHDIMGGTLYAEDATSRAVLNTKPAQVLHIAAHGEHRLDQPDLSYLQLADGQLYADDLLQHDLSYELVTLSACETGRAKAAAQDELIGLARGFLYAGAASLLVSLWQVDDASTYRLMEGVYRALHAGVPKGAALQSAQRQMLAEQPSLHPAHWGAFQLIGDAGPLSGLGA